MRPDKSSCTNALHSSSPLERGEEIHHAAVRSSWCLAGITYKREQFSPPIRLSSSTMSPHFQEHCSSLPIPHHHTARDIIAVHESCSDQCERNSRHTMMYRKMHVEQRTRHQSHRHLVCCITRS